MPGGSIIPEYMKYLHLSLQQDLAESEERP